jgi:hypothetical protein
LGCTPWVRHEERRTFPFDDNSFSEICRELILTIPAKRRRAMLASNPLRNSRWEGTADDGKGVLLLSRPIA